MLRGTFGRHAGRVPLFGSYSGITKNAIARPEYGFISSGRATCVRSATITRMNWLTVLQDLGAFAIASGLLTWLIRKLVSQSLARDLEAFKAGLTRATAIDLESYRAQLDRSIFVTRAQFETEFEAYKRLFEGVGEVRLAIAGTRPVMNVTRPSDTREDRLRDLNERLNLLIEAHNKAVKTVEHLSPFYPQDIYVKLEQCLTAARGEIADIQTGGDETLSFGWHQQGQKRRDEFFAAYNALSEAIRQRISALAIIPRS